MHAEFNKRVHMMFLNYADARNRLTSLNDANKQIEHLNNQLQECEKTVIGLKVMQLCIADNAAVMERV